MPFHVLLEGMGTGPQIPAHLTRISISLITTSTDLTNKVVKGKVVQKGPLVSLAPDNFILKTVIQEEDSELNASSQNLSINVVLFGELAKNFSQGVNQEDMVVAAGFTMSKSPTVRKDNLHPFNLLLSGDDACIYVFRPKPPPDDRSLLANRRSSTLSAEVSRKTKVPKYTYVRLGDLTAGSVVNVYGVVVFFKQPFKSRGTDSCSILKITDQSNQNITCSIFCEKLEDHPKIFQIGDIVRMHRVKAQFFKDSISLVNTFGFSVVTFDGTVGGAMEPRTSSRSFHFNQEDRQTVEELRSWASSQALFPTVSAAIHLSAVQPKSYFDLNCQLLAKAPIDSTCILLRVWDGTRCPHTLLKVNVEPNVTEGPSSFSKEKENIIANVFVYDNHLDCARKLKLGSFLRIYNLRANPGHSNVPGLTSSHSVDHLAFHLHGGTSYGRGIQVLPEDSLDVQELKRVLEAFPHDDMNEPFDLNDSALLEVWSTPPELLDGKAVKSSTERGDSPDMPLMTLSELKQCELSRVHHVRAQLRSYEPRRLHQALKLYCSKCTSMQEIPDEELVAGIFSEASSDYEPCNAPPWALLSAFLTDSPVSPDRALTLLLPRQLMSDVKTKGLIFLMGTTLEETYRLAASYQNIVPVRSSGREITLLDLSAPFLFRGRKRHYGCKQCSETVLRDPSAEGVKVIDEKVVAEVLGVQLLQCVLLMKLELQDATDTLEVFLWTHAESFFGVSAEDAAANQEAQNSIRQTMESLCPPGGSMDQHPWLDLFLTAYQTKDDVGQNQTCYQICQTTLIKPPPQNRTPTPPEPPPPPSPGSEITSAG
ncbi:protection of telomeres protein 1 isoform X1 [Amphiprion ocellaris]|uniref:Protection of telomeres protein 1 n=2 Tax=Amphiprion ocellaris TaxID=80972 RepID=A0A3Q1BY47_AMPOC|nr:protection of telomeres protein 1 isoform X1 [Amphiprion ocellaris]XP_054865144.1 protection of telomeres protein 1 isoform X1 [Amphiprion ocellaris]